MQKHTLKVTKRDIFGKKLKALRKTGVLPGNVYGKDLKSTAVQVPTKDFQAVYDKVGSSGVVYLELEGKEHPVLIHALAYDYMNNRPIHADFFQVNLKEKVKTTVPLHITGEPKAVTEKLGMLMQPVSEIEVEALPTDLPEAIELDVTEMAAVGDTRKVGELAVDTSKVTVLTDPELVVVSIAELVSAEAEEDAAAAAAQAEAATTEGEAPAEGTETPTAEGEEKEKAPAEEKSKE
jgi:large subunit ribosomal protein L25